MVYRVEIAPRALSDIDDAYSFLKYEDPGMAAAWLLRMSAAILSLENMPTRCALDPVSEDLGQEIRLLLYGKKHNGYKIFFSITKAIVRVFHIRHAARRPLLAQDFKLLAEDA